MKTMKNFLMACAVAALCNTAFGSEPVAAEDVYDASGLIISPKSRCTVRKVAGRWLFATAIGRQMLPNFPPDKDITALGTMVIQRDGTVSGTFDVTVEDTVFMAGIPYDGSVVVNPDCTGTLTFVTGAGSARTDTIAVVDRSEIIGMSQDPANLWTYQARRVGAFGREND